jgi:hypothetical protein
LIFAIGVAYAQGPRVQQSTLESELHAPPEAAKPRAWWHWMSGNVTQEGITADLEWMHRTGIAGIQTFDGDLGVAQYLDKPVIWMTPEWKAAFQHAGAETERLHMEMAMAASGGWSETAGPWVKPEESMKKAVWSETAISGGQHFHGVLPLPPRVNGPFQGLGLIDLPNIPMIGGAMGIPLAKQAEAKPDRTFYADTVVLAYRRPRIEADAEQTHPKITSSDPTLHIASITDHNYETSGRLNLGGRKR